jgi:ribonuclease HI
MPIKIACDGSSIQQGNYRKGDDTPRPGAAGFIAVLPDGLKVRKAVHDANGLIGGMETQALKMSLEFAMRLYEHHPKLRSEGVTVISDSEYAVKGFNEWLKAWEANDFKKGKLANIEDWRTISNMKADLGDAVKVVWQKGHSTGRDEHSLLNNEVDVLVNTAARTQKSTDDTHLAFPHALSLQPTRHEQTLADIAEVSTRSTAVDSSTPGTLSDLPSRAWNGETRVRNTDGSLLSEIQASKYRSTEIGLGSPLAALRIDPDHAQRMYDYASKEGFVAVDPPWDTTPSEPRTPGRTVEFLEKAESLLANTSPEPAQKPMTGIHAQALALMAQAAADPQMSSLIAAGLEMALDERRLTARYDRNTVDAAQALQAALEKRGTER